MSNDVIRIGVSQCLLGDKVRYDGEQRLFPYVTDVLSRFFDMVPVCPEVEVGMGVPRETVDLKGDPDQPRMIASVTGKDWTGNMTRWSHRRARELGKEEIAGFIFKKNSPSCGVFNVPVIRTDGRRVRKGRGLFAAILSRHLPLIPLEDEARLEDPILRENFLVRVVGCHRLQRTFSGRWRRQEVIEFHQRSRYLLMAHSPKVAKELDNLVPAIASFKPTAFRSRYQTLYMSALTRPATIRGHLRALRHGARCLRGLMEPTELKRLENTIEEYGQEKVPLVVPRTLLKQAVDLRSCHQLQDQFYLAPRPEELMLLKRP